MLGWLVGWLGLPGGCLPFSLVFCQSSASWIPGLLPVALLFPSSQTFVCVFISTFTVPSGISTAPELEWVMPWPSCLVKVPRLSCVCAVGL